MLIINNNNDLSGTTWLCYYLPDPLWDYRLSSRSPLWLQVINLLLLLLVDKVKRTIENENSVSLKLRDYKKRL